MRCIVRGKLQVAHWCKKQERPASVSLLTLQKKKTTSDSLKNRSFVFIFTEWKNIGTGGTLTGFRVQVVVVGIVSNLFSSSS